MFDQNLFHVSEEVRAALGEGGAVVALESTVISHGLPRPQNLETARRLEQAVREGGAVPATVAVLGGRLCVGLEETQLARLAEGEGVRKVSRRDLPLAVAKGEDGATTVAGTLWIASRGGLPIDARADTAEEVARVARARDALGLEAALVVTVPVPEGFEVDEQVMEESLSEALSVAAARGVTGRELTPFLLAHMSWRSGGATLRANVALLENNARVAAEIAVALAS